MTADWIKMRPCLLNEPEVVGMARDLGCTRQHVVGCLLSVWGVGDTHACHRSCPGDNGTSEGHLSRYCPADIDQICGQPGFAAAMMAAGWLVEHADGMAFPHWDAHNSKSAKVRASESKKKQRQRATHNEKSPDMSRSCPDDNGTKSGLEKRREDITGTGANAPAEDGRAADRRPAPSRVDAAEKEIPGLSESDRKRWAELLVEPQPFPGMVDGNSTASLQSLERVDVVRWFQGALATSKPLTGPSALDLVLVLSCAAKAKTKGGIANRVAYFAARLIGGEWVNDTGAVVAESQWLAQQFREGKVRTVRQREECAA